MTDTQANCANGEKIIVLKMKAKKKWFSLCKSFFKEGRTNLTDWYSVKSHWLILHVKTLGMHLNTSSYLLGNSSTVGITGVAI